MGQPAYTGPSPSRNQARPPVPRIFKPSSLWSEVMVRAMAARVGLTQGFPLLPPAPALAHRPEGARCDSDACWCSWPPVRVIPSTGQTYTVEELPSEGETRVFAYKYL